MKFFIVQAEAEASGAFIKFSETPLKKPLMPRYLW